MPEIPIPTLNPPTPDRIGIGSLNVRTANGTEPAQGGGTIPAGQVSVSITPQEWGGETFVRARPTVVIPDVVAWLTALAVGSDANAAEAATRFARVQSDLLWLTRLRLSQDGVCDPPTA